LKKSPRPHLLNILNYKLFVLKNKKYLNHINNFLLNTELIEQLETNINITYLDNYIVSTRYNELFLVNNDGSIKFLHHQNLIQFDFEKKSLPKTIAGLVNINIKNKQSYELIKVITQLQEKFLLTNNKQDLIYFSHKDILVSHQKQYNTALVSPNISTISHNTFYRDQNNNIKKLSYLLPKKHFIIYIHIKYLLNKYENLTDVKLSFYLKNEFNIEIEKVKIYEIRKRYLIPNKSNRIKNLYLEYEKNYTTFYHLKSVNVQELANITAVYELVTIKSHKYPYKSVNTVYIGSTNNLKRRLTQYITNLGHTEKLKHFIIHNEVYFRFIETDNYKDLEKEVLEGFYIICGSYPFLNSNRVL